MGRDLAQFGALAFDVTHSHVSLDHDSAYGKGKLDGNSFRVSYAKDFDELNSRVTFAGYRFSEKNFMTMSEYLDANQSDMARTGNDKEMYTITYSQNFAAAGVSIYLNYSHRTYWDRPEQTNYNLMFSHYFNMGSIRNMSISVTGYRYEYDDNADKGMYLSMSIPWSDSSTRPTTVPTAADRTAARSVTLSASMTQRTTRLTLAPASSTAAWMVI